ncbi:class I SAM-dependent methyltransferase [Thiorhodococcus minor]|uniref:class I SAM-dependent methyltransferase n=1 Tax=Thiorhodococcus minor TaxID=57489 RepID=UPI001ADCFFBA|nr:class I SAM-dependent methyltransferase [Thiorhodococcus minor]
MRQRDQTPPSHQVADIATGDLDGLRRRWDERYRGRAAAPEPAAVLRHFAHLVPTTGSALDLACGLGGNALWLAERGLEVCAWDLSAVAIERLRAAAAERPRIAVAAEVRDLIAHPPAPHSFDLICVVRFLDRGLAPKIAAALRPGGLLFYETFTREEAGGDGPSDPAFRLAPNELLELFGGLVVRGYREEGRLAVPASALGNLALMVAEKAL